ncbi:MAG: GNAT family N-acetyltransferase [Armatimonadota bacterium]|nr:GNAT family N-acetyltransferase [bacterium]
MPDMLVKLLEIPDDSADIAHLKTEGINIRRIHPYEVSVLRRFCLSAFHEGWADEVLNAFAHQPVTCYVATHEKKIIGFAAYECTRRNFFGPMGVLPEYCGKRVGEALFLACMRGLYEYGYAYAIIGGAGPVDFYLKCCSSMVIPDSVPGIYVDNLER